MSQLALATAAAILIPVLWGCGGTPQQQGNSPVTVEQPHWTGTIRPRDSRTGEARPSRQPGMYQGSVRMTPSENVARQTSIHILLSSPESSGSLSWVLASGRCGAIEAPVLPISAFDPLDVGSNGRAEATADIPFEFPTNGSYHIDFFSGNSARLSEVVACASLKFRED